MVTDQDMDLTDEIRASISTESLLETYHYPFDQQKVKNREFVMKCPFHDDTKPSLNFNMANQQYFCFSCGAKGDAFDWVAHHENLSIKTNFKEIRARMAEIAGIAMNDKGEPTRASYEEIRTVVNAKIKAEPTLKDKAAEEYLERKCIDIRELGIPWGAEPDGSDIVIPMHGKDLAGVIVGAQRGKKRMIPKSHIGLFYNPEEIIGRGEEVFVVEGLSDYLTMLASGYRNVIGLASATMDTTLLAEALAGYKDVSLCLDLDKHKASSDNRGSLTGAKAMTKLADKINKRKTNVKIYELGGDRKYDINDLFVQGGPPAVKKFFTEHVTSLNALATSVGITASTDAFNCAKVFLSKNHVAVDMSVRQQWICDPETNVWRLVKKNEVENRVRMAIENIRSTGHTTKLISETVKYISMLTADTITELSYRMSRGSFVTVDPKNLEKTVFLCLKDGKYFPFSDIFEPYKPEDYVFSTLDVSYSDISEFADRDFERSEFVKFLDQVFDGDADIDERKAFIQEWFGYIMLPTNIFEKFLVIVGGGGNGKSTLLDCIAEIIGDGNFSNMELEELATSRFASSHLLGKYANLCSEGTRSNVLESPALKKITGGDVLTAEQKFCDQFQFRPFCKLIIASNYEPAVSDDSDWLGRRMQLIRFRNTFRGRENVFLKDQLREEKSLILAWAIVGLKRLLRNQKFELPPTVKDGTRELLESANMMTPFIEHINRVKTPGFGQLSGVDELYREFSMYLQDYEGRSKKYVPKKRRFVSDMIMNGFKLSAGLKGTILIPQDIEEVKIDDLNFDDD